MIYLETSLDYKSNETRNYHSVPQKMFVGTTRIWQTLRAVRHLGCRLLSAEAVEPAVATGKAAQPSTRTEEMKSASGMPATAAIDKLMKPTAEGAEKPHNPKLEAIVASIASLNLLEVADLSALLKKRLNLPETSFMAPMAQMSAPVAAAQEEEEVEPKKVQTSFKVKMLKYDETQKVALIKEVKNLLEGMNLVQAKKFVESTPTIVKDDVTKEEAEKLKEAFTKVGAVIEIE